MKNNNKGWKNTIDSDIYRLYGIQSLHSPPFFCCSAIYCPMYQLVWWVGSERDGGHEVGSVLRETSNVVGLQKCDFVLNLVLPSISSSTCGRVSIAWTYAGVKIPASYDGKWQSGFPFSQASVLRECVKAGCVFRSVDWLSPSVFLSFFPVLSFFYSCTLHCRQVRLALNSSLNLACTI